MNPDKLEQNSLSFTVGEADAGKRLDAYLAFQVPDWSRARLQRLIADEDVVVNLLAVKPSYRVKAGDEIEVELTVSPQLEFVAENIHLQVLHEDDDLIVINKPAGLVVHPGAGNQTGTLANALAYHFNQLSQSAGAIRPGIVHRLDRDTSGVMVVAKTDIAHQSLADQFQSREVDKHYLALVHGAVAAKTGKIDQPIARDPANRIRMAIILGGRSALTLFKVERRYERFTLLDVELKTGRTHQIRVHLAWLKHPVVGDEVYGGGRDNIIQSPRIRAAVRKLKRQFLHAARLAFHHPRTNERMTFTAPLPVELIELLAVLEAPQS